ncbi:MAG: BrxA/BrxB family bacilliredoxin [Planctomycetes bacterium]|nr:BrxA/BrxB family bacilliredoxin [Planctomycetota bacterium]
MYDETMVKPMREELSSKGVKELISANDVTQFMESPSTTKIVLVNSVCGCAAGSARPGFLQSLTNNPAPTEIATVFAGVDSEAVEKARSYFVGYPPSSPAIALFRDNKLVHLVQRQDIEGNSAENLDKLLTSLYNKYCGQSVNQEAKIFDPMAEVQISVKETKELLDEGCITLLDCRETGEREVSNIDGSQLITQDLAEDMVRNWDKSQEIVIYCHHGMRSLQAVKYFEQYGFNNLKSMEGGIEAWSSEIDSTVPTY